MLQSVLIAAAASADLDAAPISRDWVLDGKPETRSKELARSHDRTSYVTVWDCTAGRFNWHYSKDETLVVISGEAFISDENGVERPIGPGDVEFFQAGTSAAWRVPQYIQKNTLFRQTLPRPLGLFVISCDLFLPKARAGRKA